MTAKAAPPPGPATALEAIAMIEAATDPGSLFGTGLAGTGVAGTGLAGTGPARTYRLLARMTHPDACPGDPRAARAFARLAELWRQHQGHAGPAALAARGDIANLYRTPRGLLKLARDPADSDLIDREAAALATLRRLDGKRFGPYFPALVQAQRITDPRTGAERRGNLLGVLDGFVSLAQVRAAFDDGVDPRDAAWMWRRLLVAVGAAHQAGLVHGAVLPEHVMIHPAEHGLVLIDWCYSAGPGGALPAMVTRYASWYPREVLAGGVVGPDLDIWLASACMRELIGAAMPPPLLAFINGCMLASPGRRPADAWRLLAELDELLGRLYGPRSFRPFAIPA